ETPPLTYPEGYFALANPEQVAMNDISMFPPSSYNDYSTNPTIQNGTNLMDTPQIVPTPNNNAVKGTIPDSPFSFGGTYPTIKTPPVRQVRTPKPPKVKNDSPKELPKLDGDATADNKDDKDKKPPEITSEPVTDFKPNKKPLEDFADDILAKRADKQSKQANLDLTKSFKVKMSGVLTEEGKLDPKKSSYVKLKPEEQGDQEMVDIAKGAIEAINNSGLFYYLKNLGVEKVDFTLIQDDKQIYAVISSSQKDENQAKSKSSSFNNLLTLAKLTVKEDELKTLLNSAKVEPQGKNFVLNFNIDKPTAQKMIEKKLQEAEAKKKEAEKIKQPNSTAQTTNTNQETAK
ncbi:MAG: hypothetical protein M3Q33_05865, partial [Acidobacteriota bacterium]|nr:hypothetical protein [Acidobacteriota bacterium]